MESSQFADGLRAAIKWLNKDIKENKTTLETKFKTAPPAFTVRMFQKFREIVLENNLIRLGKKIGNILEFYFKLQIETY